MLADLCLLICHQYDAVPSEYVPLAILHRRLMSAKDRTQQMAIRQKMIALLQV
jgi:hypothetical protein